MTSSTIMIPTDCNKSKAQQLALVYLTKGGFEFSATRNSALDLIIIVPGFDDVFMRNEMGRALLGAHEFRVINTPQARSASI